MARACSKGMRMRQDGTNSLGSTSGCSLCGSPPSTDLWRLQTANQAAAAVPRLVGGGERHHPVPLSLGFKKPFAG
jgi:hypothetical protein